MNGALLAVVFQVENPLSEWVSIIKGAPDLMEMIFPCRASWASQSVFFRRQISASLATLCLLFPGKVIRTTFTKIWKPAILPAQGVDQPLATPAYRGKKQQVGPSQNGFEGMKIQVLSHLHMSFCEFRYSPSSNRGGLSKKWGNIFLCCVSYPIDVAKNNWNGVIPIPEIPLFSPTEKSKVLRGYLGVNQQPNEDWILE